MAGIKRVRKRQLANVGIIAGLQKAVQANRQALPSVAMAASIRPAALKKFVQSGSGLSLAEADRLSQSIGLVLRMKTKIAPARAVALFQRGMVNREVASRLGVSLRSVIRYRKLAQLCYIAQIGSVLSDGVDSTVTP